MKRDKLAVRLKKRYCSNCGNGVQIDKVGKTSISITFKCSECGEKTTKILQLRGVRGEKR